MSEEDPMREGTRCSWCGTVYRNDVPELVWKIWRRRYRIMLTLATIGWLLFGLVSIELWCYFNL